MAEIYERCLAVRVTIAEDMRCAEVLVTRHYTDGRMESQAIVFTPGDVDDDGDLPELARETVRMIAEHL